MVTTTIIKGNNGDFHISLRLPRNDRGLLLSAKTIEDSREILEYSDNFYRSCETHHQDYIYSPTELKYVINTLANRKLYGIIDTLPCGSGHSVLFLTRYNHDVVEISYPLLFIKTCKEEKCVRTDSLKSYERYAVTFYPRTKFQLASTFEQTDCTPPNSHLKMSD